MPQCALRSRAAGAGPVHVTANVDSGPQPFLVLERTAVEASQQFSGARHASPPDITGLGLDADWFPDQQQLMTTDGARLITVSVDWPAAPQARRQRLAEVVARAYLCPSAGR